MAEVVDILSKYYGEGLIKGCLKCKKVFETVKLGDNVNFDHDVNNTLGWGSHVIALMHQNGKLGHLDDQQAQIISALQDELHGSPRILPWQQRLVAAPSCRSSYHPLLLP